MTVISLLRPRMVARWKGLMEQARWPTGYRVSLDSVCWITRVLPRGSRFSGLTLFIVMHACLDLDVHDLGEPSGKLRFTAIL